MKTSRILISLSLASIAFACQQSESAAYESSADMTDSVATEGFVSSSAAVENEKHKGRKFIRTADLKFRVKSVIQSTYTIENIVSKEGGFVTYTNLKSDMNYENKTQVSADSTLETNYFTVNNSIVLRVPNYKLDTTLKQIAKTIEYLDYRIIKADDVALNILANSMTQKRMTKNEDRLTKAIDSRGKKLKETAISEELLLNKQEQSDNAYLANLSLDDQVNYSTVNLSLYQKQSFTRELVANDKNIKEYEPHLGLKIKEALVTGWDVLETIIVFLFQIWWLFLIATLGYLVYRRVRQE